MQLNFQLGGRAFAGVKRGQAAALCIEYAAGAPDLRQAVDC